MELYHYQAPKAEVLELETGLILATSGTGTDLDPHDLPIDG